VNGKLVQQEQTFRWNKYQMATDLGISLGPRDQVTLNVVDVTGDLQITVTTIHGTVMSSMPNADEVR
jgi:hypothetical protein